MPSRREFVSTVGAAGLAALGTTAGCLGSTTGRDRSPTESPHDRSETESQSPSPTASETPAVLAGECRAESHDWTDPVREDVSPRPLPDGPPTMTADAVESFVTEYEETYLYDSVLQRETKRAGAVTGSVSVRATDFGFVVTLRSWFHYTLQAPTTDTTATATAVAADGPHTWRRYAVTDTRLVRATGSYDRKPPISEGAVVECWGT